VSEEGRAAAVEESAAAELLLEPLLLASLLGAAVDSEAAAVDDAEAAPPSVEAVEEEEVGSLTPLAGVVVPVPLLLELLSPSLVEPSPEAAVVVDASVAVEESTGEGAGAEAEGSLLAEEGVGSAAVSPAPAVLKASGSSCVVTEPCTHEARHRSERTRSSSREVEEPNGAERLTWTDCRLSMTFMMRITRSSSIDTPAAWFCEARQGITT
jgi:hypothetical protein